MKRRAFLLGVAAAPVALALPLPKSSFQASVDQFAARVLAEPILLPIETTYGVDNTLTHLIPQFYEALDVVSRELTGFMPPQHPNCKCILPP